MSKIIDFIIDSINASRERLKLTIATFYIGLLALYHWKALAILFFGGIPMLEKIDKINELYADWEIRDWCLKSLFVLGVSIISMVLFPLIMWLVERLLKTINEGRDTIQRDQIKIKRTDDEEQKEHEYELLQIASGRKSTEEFVKQIEGLKDENNYFKTELNNLNHKQNEAILEERERSAKAIDNLNLGFKNVEENYIAQIKELSRQLENIRKHSDIELFNANKAEDQYEGITLKNINHIYRRLSPEQKEIIEEVVLGHSKFSEVKISYKNLELKQILDMLNDLKMVRIDNIGQESYGVTQLEKLFRYRIQ